MPRKHDNSDQLQIHRSVTKRDHIKMEKLCGRVVEKTTLNENREGVKEGDLMKQRFIKAECTKDVDKNS